MNKRDWQADMTECQTWQTRTTSSLPSIGIHWLQQYAIWKAKAYEAEVKAHEAEFREKKLKEAIETAIKEKAVWGDAGNALDVVVRYLSDTLSILYPKEATE